VISCMMMLMVMMMIVMMIMIVTIIIIIVITIIIITVIIIYIYIYIYMCYNISFSSYISLFAFLARHTHTQAPPTNFLLLSFCFLFLSLLLLGLCLIFGFLPRSSFLLRLLSHILGKIVETFYAHGLQVEITEEPALDLFVAADTHEALLVPLFCHCVDGLASDGLLAFLADCAESLVVMGRAIGLAVLLKVLAAFELLVANGADEMLWMPLLAHGGEGPALDGLLAAVAGCVDEEIVVLLAVHLLVPFEGVPPAESNAALRTGEVLGMDLLVAKHDIIAIDGLAALAAEDDDLPKKKKRRM